MREPYFLYFVVCLHFGLGQNEKRPQPNRSAGTIVQKRPPMGKTKTVASSSKERKVPPPKKKSPKIGLPGDRSLFDDLKSYRPKIFELESLAEWGVNIALENKLDDGALLMEIFQKQNSKPTFRAALWSWFWTREELKGYSTNGFIPYPVLRNPVQVKISQRNHQLIENDSRHFFRIMVIDEDGFEETVILEGVNWQNSTFGKIELRICLSGSKGNSLNAEVIDLPMVEGMFSYMDILFSL